MTEFTKGPWSIEHSRMSNGILEEDEAISICTDDSHCWDICAVWKDVPIGDAKANANLIAAAPKMYKFLDDLASGRGIDYPIEQLLAEARGEL